MKVKLVELADGLDVGVERRRGVKKKIVHLIKKTLCFHKKNKS